MTAETPLTLREVAEHFSVPVWKVRRIFDRKLLIPMMVGGTRLVRPSQLADVRQALQRAGYLK
jgi:hypothetical protein